MDQKRIDLFDLAERRLAWADRRQAVLAQNIANVNTPAFKPHDLRPFESLLQGAHPVAPLRTQPRHLAGTLAVAVPNEVVDRAHAQSPDGNAVTLDEQLVKISETENTHRLATAIYRKYLGMFSMALGRAGAG
ncbi:MAG: flagellar basal body protein [Acetobacteraceae bacterium]